MNWRSDNEGQPSHTAAAQQSESELAEAILCYLAEYPQAMDTLEGISEWWVMRAHVRVELDTLLRVLRELIECGCLEETGPAENPRYQLKPRTPSDE